jgi:hypothetical protein
VIQNVIVADDYFSTASVELGLHIDAYLSCRQPRLACGSWGRLPQVTSDGHGQSPSHKCCVQVVYRDYLTLDSRACWLVTGN